MQNNLFVNFLFIAFLYTCTCHYVSDERIFDGSEAPTHTYPWMVSIRMNLLNLIKRDCGGVLISDTFVLTAASCFENLTTLTQYFVIKAGVHRIGMINEPTEQVRYISQLIFHPNYTIDNYLNDLALIRVSFPFHLDKLNVFPIVLSDLISVENRSLIATGWGGSSYGIIPIPLKQVIVQENVECTQSALADPTTQLCASGTCSGDTGGPLMIFSFEEQQYELVGITSYRDECKTEGIYTRIAPYINLILSIINKPPPTHPPPPTFPTLPPTRSTTMAPDIIGPPIPFVCNTSYSCGCSSVPVVFHDEISLWPDQLYDEGRIVGGETAQPHSWSWTVSLRMPLLGHFCGGSLIDNEWVLTAAHCFPSLSTTVHVGVHDEKLPSPSIHQVEEIIMHPNFIPSPKFLNDIALLRISPPVNFTMSSDYAGLSCLPPNDVDIGNYPNGNIRLAVIGWGKLISGGARSSKLRQVRVKSLLKNDRRCSDSIFDSNRQFCAMADGGGKDSCQGDSGGPIHQWLGDRWEQVGIVSFGTGCALANHPGIYTRLSFYYDWIQTTINEMNRTTETFTSTATTVLLSTSIVIDGNSTYGNTGIIHETILYLYVAMLVGLRFFD